MFGLSFLSSAPPLIGVDIGSSSIKLVELSGSRGNPRLERYAIELLPRGAVVDGNIDDIEAVAEALRRAWRKSGFRIKHVAMALPAAAVITKRIALPANLRDDELEMQVESEASQYIPFALDEVSLDFQVLGPAANSTEEIDVLIAASRLEKVEDRVAVAQAAGLKPVVMDIESYALRASVERLIWQLPNEGQGVVVAVFYIGASATALTVMHDGEAIYEREQPFGGQQLTSDIARTYGIPVEEAEQKKRAGELPAEFGQAIQEPFVDSLAHEIGRALQYFFTSTPHHRVHYVLLAGATSTLPGLTDRVTEVSGFASMVVNPFDDMAFGSGAREARVRREAPAYLTACGLAMRGFVQ